MMESLKGMYSEVSAAVKVMYQMNTARQEGRAPVEHLVPVIPGVFAGECVTLTYAKDARTKVRTVTLSAPVDIGTEVKTSSFPVPYGRTPEVPEQVLNVLRHFEKTGPGRLSHRVRELVKELLRAGVRPEEIYDEVDLAVVESVMNT